MGRNAKPLKGSRALALTIKALRRQATSNDWETREDAGFTLRDLIEQNFEEGIMLTQDWISDPSERVRRALCLSCMQRKAHTDLPRVRILLKRLAPLMKDESLYVRKCCGPFVVGYLGYTYPTVTLPWLKQQARRRDLNVHTNVAKAFTQALGGTHPEAGLAILEIIAADERPRVRSAVTAALRNIAKRNKKYVAEIKSRFCSRYDIEVWKN
jgi:3-methyladenine DNA glycosylase AlkC